ncbi:MAG: hypothetical protein ACFFD4_23020, partial [Candidatus Odinarchaeota archaeon]
NCHLASPKFIIFPFFILEMKSKAVNLIIKYCLEHRSGNVIVGDFSGIKQNGNLGKVNNQNFQCIPYSKLWIAKK